MGENKKEIPEIQFEIVETEKLSKHLFLKYCAKQLDRSALEQAYKLQPMAIIAEEEEKEIVALKDPTSSSYKKFYSLFQTISQELNVNIMVFLGHISECKNYMKAYDFNFRPKNSLPVFVFIIGCNSKNLAKEYNEYQSMAANGYYFFGFSTMVHVFNGDIYLCPNPMVDTPSMECRYPDTLTEKKKLELEKNEYEALFSKPPSEQLEILKCCSTRQYQYTKAYIEGFNTRKCIKLTPEKMMIKILTIVNDDGTFYTYDEYMYDFGNFDPFVFGIEDGINCSPDTPCTSVPKNNSSLSYYDKLTQATTVIQEIYKLYGKIVADSTQSQKRLLESDEKMRSYLSSLRKEDQTFVLNYKVRINLGHIKYSFPIFFIPFFVKLPYFTKDVLTKYAPIIKWTETSTKSNETILHELLNMTDVYSPKEMYRIFLQIHSVSKEVFLQTDARGETAFVRSFQKLPGFVPIFQFYLKYFPSKIGSLLDTSKSKTTLLHAFLDATLPTDLYKNQNELFVQLLENLLIFGADPNETPKGDLSIVEYYEKNITNGFINPQVIRLFYIYGFADPDDIKNKRINKYGKLLIEESKEYKEYIKDLEKEKNDLYKKMINMYGSYNSNNNARERYESSLDNQIIAVRLQLEFPAQYIQRIFYAYNSIPDTKEDLEKLRKSKTTASSEIDSSVAMYEAGYRAIPAVKQLYSNIQKYTRSKKLQLSDNMKQAFLNGVATLYETKADENEGNSALRRYNLLSNAFTKFKQETSTQKPLITNAWGGRRRHTRHHRLRRNRTRKH